MGKFHDLNWPNVDKSPLISFFLVQVVGMIYVNYMQMLYVSVKQFFILAGSANVKEEAAYANSRRRAVLSYVKSHSAEFSGLFGDADSRLSEGDQWRELQRLVEKLFHRQEMT